MQLCVCGGELTACGVYEQRERARACKLRTESSCARAMRLTPGIATTQTTPLLCQPRRDRAVVISAVVVTLRIVNSFFPPPL